MLYDDTTFAIWCRSVSCFRDSTNNVTRKQPNKSSKGMVLVNLCCHMRNKGFIYSLLQSLTGPSYITHISELRICYIKFWNSMKKTVLTWWILTWWHLWLEDSSATGGKRDCSDTSLLTACTVPPCPAG